MSRIEDAARRLMEALRGLVAPSKTNETDELDAQDMAPPVVESAPTLEPQAERPAAETNTDDTPPAAAESVEQTALAIETEAAAHELGPPETDDRKTNGAVAESPRETPAGGGLILRLETERRPVPTFDVARPGATVGRGEENSVRLPDLSVSRRHARITYRQGAYWLRDLGSMSGTWVDGTRLTGPHRLEVGQIIDIGICRLTVEAAPEATPAATSDPRRKVASGRRQRPG